MASYLALGKIVAYPYLFLAGSAATVGDGPGSWHFHPLPYPQTGRARLAAVAGALPGGAPALLRTKDAPSALAEAGDAAILDALAATPAWIERPVVITSRGARVARPLERVREVLEEEG